MSNPQEKAKELLDKMLYCYQGSLDEYTAKQCALVCCDEMINNAGFIWGGRDTETGKTARDSYRTYWQEIKTELEKL